MSGVKIILASASPRRRELLEQIGLKFQVKVSDVEEKVSSVLPERVVEELSAQKAEAVLKGLLESPEDVLVIGADTVVAMEGRILGKPHSSEEAGKMLQQLSGKTHAVYTGVTLLYLSGGSGKTQWTGETEVVRKTFYERTDVTFYPLTAEEIGFYIASGDCMDKAGAYGIQGSFARYVKGIEGDYNNVVGLPIGRIYQEAKEWLTE